MVAGTFAKIIANGSLPQSIGITIGRLLGAFAISITLGTLIGFAMVKFRSDGVCNICQDNCKWFSASKHRHNNWTITWGFCNFYYSWNIDWICNGKIQGLWKDFELVFSRSTFFS